MVLFCMILAPNTTICFYICDFPALVFYILAPLCQRDKPTVTDPCITVGRECSFMQGQVGFKM